MPSIGQVRTLEDGTIQVYLENGWLTIEPAPVPPPVPQVPIPIPDTPEWDITYGNSSNPLVLSGVWPTDEQALLAINPSGTWIPDPNAPTIKGSGDIVLTPGPHGSKPMPASPPEGSVIVREDVGLMVYMNGQWNEMAIITKKTFEQLLFRLQRLEQIVDVNSRFRKIAEEDDECEIERPPQKK